jgi:6-phosphogluconolactonase
MEGSMATHPEIKIFKTRESMIDRFVHLWQDIARKALIHSGRFTVALSGGRTPVPYLDTLAKKIPETIWQNTHIFLVDERHVPWSDPDSNYGMIKKAVFSHFKISKSQLHPVPFEKTPELSAESYENSLRQFFRESELPELDLIVLGLGADGHIASLFPGNPALKETSRWTASVKQPSVPHARITLTYPVLNTGKNVIFVVEGAGKSGRVREVVCEQKKTLPASHIRPVNGSLVWLLDQEAGSELSD